MASVDEIVVTGATSLLGRFLLPRLVEHGYHVNAISRNPPADSTGGFPCHWHRIDISHEALPDSLPTDTPLIHLAPIWLLPRLLEQSTKQLPARVMAFSSTSRLTKRASANVHERTVANRLADGERNTIAIAERHAIPWTIFRPTLIYGAGLDKNISVIGNFIQRFGFFPLVGSASGKRMPVHADDLALACMSCLHTNRSHNQRYDLTGGETLSYQEMVGRVFAALGKQPRYIRIPLWSFQALIAMASLLPRYRDLTPEMARRTGMDLVFDSSRATADFGYNPRGFSPTRCDVVTGC